MVDATSKRLMQQDGIEYLQSDRESLNENCPFLSSAETEVIITIGSHSVIIIIIIIIRTQVVIGLQTFIRRTVSTLKAVRAAPAVARWLRMVMVVQTNTRVLRRRLNLLESEKVLFRGVNCSMF